MNKIQHIFNGVWQWYKGSNVISMEQALEILEEEQNKESEDENQDEDENIEITDNQCFEATGVVTMVAERYGLIDKELYFEHSDMSTIKIGTKVMYLAFKKDNRTVISKILTKKDDEWEDSVISPRPYHDRTIPGKVVSRNGRIVIVATKNGNQEIDLNKIETEFIPLIGDWVILDATVEMNEDVLDLEGRVLQIIKISPSRTKIEPQGTVTKFDLNTEFGVINADTMFSKDCCTPGYLPVVNDKVSFEAIESNQDLYTWRALKVVPLQKTNTFYRVADIEDDAELMKNKNDIIVSDRNVVSLNKIGDKSVFTIDVTNNSLKSQTIISCVFKSKSSQLSLKKPSMENSIEIQPHKTIVFVILCQAKFMGINKELIIFNFEGFKIGRLVKIQVVPPVQNDNRVFNKIGGKRYSKYLTKDMRDSILNNRTNILPGNKPMKTPAFVAVKLPMYHIPERIAELCFKQSEDKKSIQSISAEKISKSLIMDLSIQNYEDRFHTLLYIEEISIKISMRRYDMERACFIHNDGYLMLEVPDLSERRPSIIVGDRIIASNPNNPDEEQYEGYIHKTGAKHVYLKFASAFHDIYKGQDYRVQFHSSRTNFRRFHQAIDLACRSLGKAFLFPVSVPSKSAQVQFTVDDDTSLNVSSESSSDSMSSPKIDDSDKSEPKFKSKYMKHAYNFNKQRKSKEDDKFSECSSNSSDTSASEDTIKPLKLEWFDKKLNNYQKAAVINILKGEARPLPYLIFGPPGTGKTVTLIETILQILRLIPHSRLLVTAPSNSAADLIAIRLLDSGIVKPGDIVRLIAYSRISEGKIPPKLVPYCVTGDISREGTRENLNLQENGVNLNVQLSVLGRHRVTVATCMVVGTLYNMGLARDHFTHIIVDEAGQALEPEIMIPLSLLDPKSAQTILAGDPMQLGPYVYSILSKQFGLSESFFERLINRFPYIRDPAGFTDTGGYDPRLVTRLVYNYRSLPEILHLPNKLFYNSELIPVISTESGEEVEILKLVKSVLPKTNNALPPSFVFHGVRGQNYQTADCPSWYNPVEAGQVFYYVNDLYKSGVQSSDIGIITPYLKQCQTIRQLIYEQELDIPKVGSVEEFQGQEFKIIILSTVRSNESDAKNDARLGLGFISCPPRLNVAITRAQALLIIVGNPYLLVMDNYWRSVLAYSQKIGGYIGCDFPTISN